MSDSASWDGALIVGNFTAADEPASAATSCATASEAAHECGTASSPFMLGGEVQWDAAMVQQTALAAASIVCVLFALSTALRLGQPLHCHRQSAHTPCHTLTS